MKSRFQKTILALATILVAAPTMALGTTRPTNPLDPLSEKVRHELVMLPFYGVFDDLAFKVDGYKVTLLGQVTRPTLKSAAENVVKGVEGVENVDNRIEVLPVSFFDDRLRRDLRRRGRGGGVRGGGVRSPEPG